MSIITWIWTQKHLSMRAPGQPIRKTAENMNNLHYTRPSQSLRQSSKCQLPRLMASSIKMKTHETNCRQLSDRSTYREIHAFPLYALFCARPLLRNSNKLLLSFVWWLRHRDSEKKTKENLLICGGLFVVNGCLAAFSAGCRQTIYTHFFHIDVAIRVLYAEKRRIINT